MLTLSEVEYVASLACLELTEEEKKIFSQQLGEILDFFRQLDILDTEGIEPAFHSIPLKNVFRNDIKGNSIEHEKALSNAPQREGEYFKIPKIIGGGE
ncbi:MAG TPA: Asp-tRNA(Asn)/Glu-tRNA(Gln) amidotransferase subunit GatC [Candidatus Eremiobacteraeota bacterium]|nr:MAG: Aspartyl/glutamyl-tRNA(Asn/Gln) amidotransferase subunit C [bacterium ADurb.Bin363]HPZ08509.1 Asp-tRNA(Asn)/Glu-tRNA(Gln) amidotransferase subunit GatC [Candidatus Eremiobacteraeota bacterium]